MGEGAIFVPNREEVVVLDIGALGRFGMVTLA
jgi:hypothetical protein